MNWRKAIDFYFSEDQEMLLSWFDEQEKEHEGDCMDSLRVARIDNAGEMRAFEKARSCCGSSEETLTGVSGQKYIVGCNYGH
jgi:hypothetical protein